MRIGVLALQGDFHAHAQRLEQLGAFAQEIRYARQLGEVQGLVLPGGESSTNLVLIEAEGLWEPLREFAQAKPILGTCAGAILLARKVTNPVQPSLGAVDMEIERNAYGRQVDSSIRSMEPEADFAARTHGGPLETVYIRAPIIRATGPSVKVLLRDAGHPVLVEEGLHLAATFHAELTSDSRLHELFLAKAAAQ